jgi:hypothetical protein
VASRTVSKPKRSRTGDKAEVSVRFDQHVVGVGLILVPMLRRERKAAWRVLRWLKMLWGGRWMRGILVVQSDNEAEVPRGSDHKQL